MKVRLKPVKAYELLGADGRVIARLAKVSSWEGMAKLQTDDGKTLVIEEPIGIERMMTEALGAMSGKDGSLEYELVKASPSLIASLQDHSGGAG